MTNVTVNIQNIRDYVVSSLVFDLLVTVIDSISYHVMLIQPIEMQL